MKYEFDDRDVYWAMVLINEHTEQAAVNRYELEGELTHEKRTEILKRVVRAQSITRLMSKVLRNAIVNGVE